MWIVKFVMFLRVGWSSLNVCTVRLEFVRFVGVGWGSLDVMQLVGVREDR